MKLVLILPDKEFLEALEKGLDSGEISIDLSEALVLAKRTRKKNKRESMSFILPPNEQEIVDKWNNNEFIKSVGSGMISDARNKPVYSKDMDDVRPALRQALKCIGKDSIFGHMEKYFDCCVNHRHVWDGANHGFKNLGGFLRKLVRCEKAQQLPWWEQKEFPDQLVLVDDPYPEITKSVAECFGLEFTGSSVYAYDDKPKEHKSFAGFRFRFLFMQPLNSRLIIHPGQDLLSAFFRTGKNTHQEACPFYIDALLRKESLQTFLHFDNVLFGECNSRIANQKKRIPVFSIFGKSDFDPIGKTNLLKQRFRKPVVFSK